MHLGNGLLPPVHLSPVETSPIFLTKKPQQPNNPIQTGREWHVFFSNKAIYSKNYHLWFINTFSGQNVCFNNHSDKLLCRKGHCSKLGHWDSFDKVFAQEELSGWSHNFMKGFEQLKAFVLRVKSSQKNIKLWKNSTFRESYRLKVLPFWHHSFSKLFINFLRSHDMLVVHAEIECLTSIKILQFVCIFWNWKKIVWSLCSVGGCWGIDFAGKQICRVIDWRHWTR